MFRVLDNAGVTPALHPAERFTITQADIPPDWTFRMQSGADWTLEPAVSAMGDFWLRYFDGEPSARATFEAIVQKLGAREVERECGVS